MLKYAIIGLVLVTPAVAETSKELHCLQQNIYFEARNQPIMGKIAVAEVTLNRVDHSYYPDTICGVVWQNHQFSWTQDGKPDHPSDNVLEQRAWKLAGIVAKQSYRGWKNGIESFVGDAVMFHADYVDPHWKASYEPVIQINDHIFYQEK